jgi:allophanate hydrolase
LAKPIASLVAQHRADPATIAATLRETYERIEAAGDPAMFIALREEADVLAEARRLADAGSGMPLFGVPIAVKDNIDVAGLATTAACPRFSYGPARDAAAVARLRQAGALVIGKTNLDQFATGLVGVRSPYGTPLNPLRADLVPGGSSSGSAVAVARGIVPIALGTDTAGSGRVPAGLNNIVGLKPSLGLVSCAGVVPACRSLDCVSVFALTVEDAFAALSVMAGEDPADPYSRAFGLAPFAGPPPHLRIAVPRAADRLFFGDARAEAAFTAAIGVAQQLGWTVVEIEITALLEAARLLYEGAWVAERTAAVGEFIVRHPADIHPVTRAIIAPGAKLSAVDAFRGLYRLAGYARTAEHVFAGIDALMVPTAPTSYTLADLAADPIGPNSRLGTYTNFVNLLDLCGLAVPAALAEDKTPFGVTFLAPSGRDSALAGIGAAFHAATGLPLGALDTGRPPAPPSTAAPGSSEIAIAVVGAHLSGMPLNRELTELGARFLEATATAREYRLFALPGTTPPRPGLLRVAQAQGTSIAVETWALSPTAFGRLVAAVPPPLSIGSVRLIDGRLVKGFLVEAEAVAGARDVSGYGGWRAAIAALEKGG